MKNNKGQITIMMIVTVIVLIILGGICIFMLTGDNGLFVPKKDEAENETPKNEITTNNTLSTEEQNTINNENGALTVPLE